eukprot:7026509-Alexandrium_andersonii.AAC.1
MGRWCELRYAVHCFKLSKARRLRFEGGTPPGHASSQSVDLGGCSKGPGRATSGGGLGIPPGIWHLAN